MKTRTSRGVAVAQNISEPESALDAIDPCTLSEDEWLSASMAAKAAGISYEFWDSWCRRDPERYDGRENQRRWKSITPDGKVTPRTLYKMAYGNGWQGSGERPAPSTEPQRKAEAKPEWTPPALDLPDVTPTYSKSGEDAADQLKSWLAALFNPDEYIAVVTEARTKEGSAKPRPGGCGTLFRVGDLMADPSKALTKADPDAGAWVTVNTLDPDVWPSTHRQAASFSAYRYCLIEADEDGNGNPIPIDTQLTMAAKLGLPVAAATWSGSRSVHLICRVDAADAGTHRERTQKMIATCRANGFPVDDACKDLARLTRLPGARRGEDTQSLLDFDAATHGWDEWRGYIRKHRRSRIFHTAAQLTGLNTRDMPPDIWNGILAEREVAAMAGQSGSGKSWFALNLAYSVACGIPFLGIETKQRHVVYLDMEITENAFSNRMEKVRERLNAPLDADIEVAAPEVLMGMDAGQLVRTLEDEGVHDSLVIIDPLYMLIENDENSNAEMTHILTTLKQLCIRDRCTLFIVHHTRKGAAGSAAVVDRGAGAGVVGRFCNDRFSVLPLDVPEDSEAASIMEQVDAKALRLEMVLRDHPFHAPIDLFYDGVMFHPDPTKSLAEFAVQGSPQSNGARASQANRDRGEDQREKQAQLLERILGDLADAGTPATPEKVLHDYNAVAGAHGLRGVTEATFGRWLRPADPHPIHRAGGMVVCNRTQPYVR